MISTWNAAAGAIVSAILNSLVVAMVLVAGAHVLMKFARGMNAATRHVVWWAVLAAVIAVPVARPVVEWFVDASRPPVVVSAVAPVQPIVEVADVRRLDTVAQVENLPHTDLGIQAGYLPLSLMVLAAMILLVQCARVAWSYVYLRRLKRSGVSAPDNLKISFDEWVIGCGVKRPVKLLLSDDVASPIAIGFRTPAVIIPRSMVERMSGDDIDHMLLHELAHLARCDDWTNLIARILWGALAVHPVAAWALRRIDEEREVACDDWVVGVTGGAKQYALSLSRLMEFRLAEYREMLATGIGGRKSQFGDRIERLLRSATSFDPRTSMARVSGVAVALVAIVLAGTQLPSWVAFAQDDEPPVPPVPAIAEPAPAPEPVTASPAPAPRRARVPRSPAAPAPVPVLAMATPPQAPAPPATAVRPAHAAASGTSFLQALADAGYRDLTVDEIIELKNNGVSAAFLAGVNQAGWGRLQIRQVIDLRRQGVHPEYLKALKEAGFKNLTLQEAIELRNHGVRPETVREIHVLGFGPYDTKQIVELTNHGVRPDFLKALKDAGYGSADLREIVEARQHGVNASNLAEAKQYGGNLTLQQVLRLKRAGVI